MGKGTQVVAHEGMGTGTGIFFKCRYGDGHCSTLPIGYPLPSLIVLIYHYWMGHIFHKDSWYFGSKCEGYMRESGLHVVLDWRWWKWKTIYFVL